MKVRSRRSSEFSVYVRRFEHFGLIAAGMIGATQREVVTMRYFFLVVTFIALAALSSAERVLLKAKVIGHHFPNFTERVRPNGRSTGCADCFLRFIGCADCFGPFTLKSNDRLTPSDQGTYEVSNLTDNDSKTCWAVSGGGGAWFSFSWPSHEKARWPIDSVTLVNGYAKSPDRWKQNSRIRELEFAIDGKAYGRIILEDTARVQTVEFPARLNVDAKEIRFTVVSVYPGEHYDDLCLSEVQLEGGH